MRRSVLSLLAGMALVAGVAVIGQLTRAWNEVLWLLLSQIVWPGLFIWLYRRHSAALSAWLTLIGIVLTTAGATLWVIGAEALLSVASFGGFMLGYLLYSASFGPVVVVSLFLIFHALRRRLLPRPARPTTFCNGPSP